MCWGGSSRGYGGRDEGERGAVDGREEEICVFSGLGAQQEGLCATLTRGWPVDRLMEMGMEMSEERRMGYSQAAVQAQKGPG